MLDDDLEFRLDSSLFNRLGADAAEVHFAVVSGTFCLLFPAKSFGRN